MIKKTILFILIIHYFCISSNVLFARNIPKKIILNNMSYIYHANEDSKITVLQIAFYGGSSIEPAELKGISQIASRMFIQVSGSDNIKDIVSKNSVCYIRIKSNYIIITIESLSEYFDDAVKIFFKTIRKPDITGMRLNFLKKRMVQMQGNLKENYNYVLNEAIRKHYFKGTGYEGSIYGNTESLKNIKKKSISNFHKKTINLSNMILSISTDLKEDIVTKILKKNLKKFPIGEKQSFKNVILKNTENNTITKKIKGDLYTIAYSFLVRFNESLSRKEFIYGKMLETYLGKGIGSYLWTLRAKEDLTYSINSKIVFFKPFGYLYFFIKTDKENIDKTLNIYKTLIDSLNKGIDEKTFNSIIAYTTTSFQRQNEMKRALSYNLIFFEVLGLGYDFYANFTKEIKSISLIEFNKYLQRILAPSNRLSIIIGD